MHLNLNLIDMEIYVDPTRYEGMKWFALEIKRPFYKSSTPTIITEKYVGLIHTYVYPGHLWISYLV